jgi:hypothetical protein
MRYAVGHPGNAVRAVIDDPFGEPDDAAQQCLPGEVVVQLGDDPVPSGATIAGDGQSLVPPAGEQVDTSAVRAVRYDLLAASDWTQLPDAPLSDDERAAWATYRQELRDVPAAQSDVAIDSIVWPTPPQANGDDDAG